MLIILIIEVRSKLWRAGSTWGIIILFRWVRCLEYLPLMEAHFPTITITGKLAKLQALISSAEFFFPRHLLFYEPKTKLIVILLVNICVLHHYGVNCLYVPASSFCEPKGLLLRISRNDICVCNCNKTNSYVSVSLLSAPLNRSSGHTRKSAIVITGAQFFPRLIACCPGGAGINCSRVCADVLFSFSPGAYFHRQMNIPLTPGIEFSMSDIYFLFLVPLFLFFVVDIVVVTVRTVS